MFYSVPACITKHYTNVSSTLLNNVIVFAARRPYPSDRNVPMFARQEKRVHNGNLPVSLCYLSLPVETFPVLASVPHLCGS